MGTQHNLNRNPITKNYRIYGATCYSTSTIQLNLYVYSNQGSIKIPQNAKLRCAKHLNRGKIYYSVHDHSHW